MSMTKVMICKFMTKMGERFDKIRRCVTKVVDVTKVGDDCDRMVVGTEVVAICVCWRGFGSMPES